jgi:excisionase family DNA binding protein
MDVLGESVAEYLKPPQVGELLAVGHDKVLTWIHSGELRAVDVAAKRGGRPRWRVWRSDLEDFLARRAATPAPKRRRRRKQPDHVTKYY